MIGTNSTPSIDAYFKTAMRYPLDRLVAVMQGKDKSIPQTVAMMALQIKEPMVDAAKGQQAAQQAKEPSVKQRMEQQVAMLPENVGIMNLPVQQEYADGGIVAFREGGSLTPEEQAELDRRRREKMSSFFGSLAEIPSNVMNYGRRAYETVSNLPFESKTPLIRYGKQDRTGIMAYEQAPEALARMRREDPSYVPPTTSDYALPNKFAQVEVMPPATPAASPTQFVDARTAPPAAPSAGKGKGKGAAGPKKEEAAGPRKEEAAPPSPFVPGKEADLADTFAKVKGLGPDVESLYGGLAGDVESAFAERARVRELGKPKGQAYEGLEKLLAEEKGEAKGKADKLFNRALVTSGLAIAGGDSQYALQNIARGSEVGNKQYMAGIEKLEEAAKERRRQATAIEEARRAEARGDWKEQQQFMDRALDAQLNIKRDQVTGIMNVTGKNLETSMGIVNNQNQIAARDRQLVETIRADLVKQGMSDKAALERAQVMARAYGANKDPVNIATDNAAKEYDIWQKSSAGKLAGMDQAKQDAAKRRIFNEVFKRSGLPMPYPEGGGVTPPPVGGGGRFMGFEPQ